MIKAKHSKREIHLNNDRDLSPIGTKVEPPYFFGVFNKFQNTESNPFATPEWIEHCKAKIRNWGSTKNNIKFKAKKIIGRAYLSKHIAPIVTHIKGQLHFKKNITVVDIGGGFGDNYYLIDRALGNLSKRVNYLVVDNPEQCKFGVDYYKGKNKNVKFCSNIPNEKFNIAIVIGTLQYIEDWKSFIADVSKSIDGSIFVSRTPINIDGPTFVTVQSVCPAFGPAALRKIGETNLSVINQMDLDRAFYDNSFWLKNSNFHVNYSVNFKNMPEGRRHIYYIDKQYEKIKPVQQQL